MSSSEGPANGIGEVAAWLGVPAASVATLDPELRHALARRLEESDRLTEALELQSELATRVRSLVRYLHDQARIDPLTGLANRRAIEERLTEEGDRTDRYSHPVAIFVLDIDGLGAVNHQLGRHAGDALLREVAARLRWAVRSTDYVGRLGGDEFVVICPQTEEPAAASLAPALARRLGGGKVPEYHQVGISVSVGWAVRVAGVSEDSIDVLRKADQRLAAQRTESAAEMRGRPVDRR
jgi:two-component system cell cycle response regulator